MINKIVYILFCSKAGVYFTVKVHFDQIGGWWLLAAALDCTHSGIQNGVTARCLLMGADLQVLTV
jgi:hypothetical protein